MLPLDLISQSSGILSEDQLALLGVVGPILATLFVAHALYKRLRPYPSISFQVSLPERMCDLVFIPDPFGSISSTAY
jgi:hypothetical protein